MGNTFGFVNPTKRVRKSPRPADRAFLNDCGVFLHMLSYRDGYYWKAKERRESGEDKREFEEVLKQDWLEFDRRRK
jgi:hypothetical protein